MNIDENLFFLEVTLRLCSSLEIETGLQPATATSKASFLVRRGLDILDLKENNLKFVAHVGINLPEKYERIVH